MKYIDADRLRAEIEKERRKALDAYKASTRTYDIGGADYLAEAILTIMKMQQEHPEVDLEKEIEEWMKIGPHTSFPWCTIPDAIKITAEHFYELGLNAGRV